MGQPCGYGPLPTARQLKWHELNGFYAFVHFTLNTWTDREWGLGNESPDLFNPVDFSADQIVGIAREAGMGGLIITAKHHDGFCLWPSKYTEHSVKNSPWRNGSGDVVRELSDACARQGIKFGVYLSPWDRNHAEYGRPDYVECFHNQLRELLTEYGEVFEVWFDGANGGTGYYGGANEERIIDRSRYYEWDNVTALIRELQPDCVIYSDAGPDLRWVGDGHAGITGDPCWATYTPIPLPGVERPGPGVCEYREGLHGHRDGKHWMPAEDPMSIRPGWFWHPHEKPRTPDYLVRLYLQTVGRGAALCLNLAPDRRGLVPAEDVDALREFRSVLDQTFGENLVQGATVTASNVRGNDKVYGVTCLLDDDPSTYWATDDNVLTAEIVIELKAPATFNLVDIAEYLPLGQRVETWAIDLWRDQDWVELGAGQAIGSRRYWRGREVTTDRIRLRLGAPVSIAIAALGIYREPVRLTAPTIVRTNKGMAQIVADVAIPQIYYTTDGSVPTQESMLYQDEFEFRAGGIIKAKAFHDGRGGEEASAIFDISAWGWSANVENSGAFLSENSNACWESEPGLPQSIEVDMGRDSKIGALTYKPRLDADSDGIVQEYEWFVSADGKSWQLVASGEFDNIELSRDRQVVEIEPIKIRYFKFVGKRVVSGDCVTIFQLGAYKA